MGEPLVAATIDLKDFPYTPIFRARLFGSSFHSAATDSEWRAGVTLWLKSWDQVPAGSLPNDDVSLCRLAELGRDMRAWHKVRLIALRGWQECADGRLYHAVVAEGVNEAWSRKQGYRDRTEKARLTRLSQNKKPSVTEPVTEPVTESVTASKESKGKGIKKEREDSEADASGADAPDPVKTLWDRGVRLLGESQRALFGKMRKEYGDVSVLEAIVETERECPSDPAGYLVACCQRRRENGRSKSHEGALDILARAAIEHDERQGHSGPAQTAH